MLKMLKKKLIRSPHILEVILAYGGVHLISIYFLIFHFNQSILQYFYGLVIGGFIYTFIEYWFHRYLLHVSILKKAHDNHHKNPTKLKIIATPLLPVQIYEIIIMVTISYFFGCYFANLCQIGISISQVIMDYVHYFEHSSYNPWFLISARSFHKLHHRISNHDLGFGLTCTFWDYIFGTLPDKNTCKKINLNINDNEKNKKAVIWEPFNKYPYLKILQMPLPMISYLLWTPWVKTKKNIDSSIKPITFENLKIENIIIALISAIIVGVSPFFV